MYRPSQTPRLAVSSDRVVPAPVFRHGHPVAQAPTPSKRHPPSRGLGTWLNNSDNSARRHCSRSPPHRVSEETTGVVVFQSRQSLPLMLHLSCLLTKPD